MPGGLKDLDVVTPALDRCHRVRQEQTTPMGHPATPSRGGNDGALPRTRQLMSGMADSSATGVSLRNRDVATSDECPGGLGASFTNRGTCVLWAAQKAGTHKGEEHQCQHQHQHQLPHTYDDAGVLHPAAVLGATFSLLDTPAVELYCEPPVLPLPGAVPPPPAAPGAQSPAAAGQQVSPRSTTYHTRPSNDLHSDPDQDCGYTAHCGGGEGLELHLLMPPGDLQAAVDQLQLQQQPPDEGGGGSGIKPSGRRLSTATTAADRLLVIFSWERYGGAGAALGTVASTSSRSSSWGPGRSGHEGAEQHSAGGQLQQMVTEPSCVDMAAGRVTARVPPELLAGLRGKVPGTSFCGRLHVDLYGAKDVGGEELAGRACGRRPWRAGGPSGSGRSPLARSHQQQQKTEMPPDPLANAMSLERLGCADVLVLPAPAAAELGNQWRNMVMEVQQEGWDEGGAARSHDGPPGQPAAAEAAAASCGASAAATTSAAAAAAAPSGSAGAGAVPHLGPPRYDPAGAEAFKHHMAPLLQDIGLLLLGPGPGLGWGVLGALGLHWSGAAVADFDSSQLRMHVLEWLLHSDMDACAALVVAACADGMGAQDTTPREGHGQAAAAASAAATTVAVGEEQAEDWELQESEGCSEGLASTVMLSAELSVGGQPLPEQHLLLPGASATPPSGGRQAPATAADTGVAAATTPAPQHPARPSALELTLQLLSWAPPSAGGSAPHPAAAHAPAASGSAPGAADVVVPAASGTALLGPHGNPQQLPRAQGLRICAERLLEGARLVLRGFPDAAQEAEYQLGHVAGATAASGARDGGGLRRRLLARPLAASCAVCAACLMAKNLRLLLLGAQGQVVPQGGAIVTACMTGAGWLLAPAGAQLARWAMGRTLFGAYEVAEGGEAGMAGKDGEKGGVTEAGAIGEALEGPGGGAAHARAPSGPERSVLGEGTGGGGSAGGSNQGCCVPVEHRRVRPQGRAGEGGRGASHFSLVLYDTLAAGSTGLLASLLASLLGLLTYTCSRPCLHLKQDNLGCVLFVFLSRGVFAPLAVQLLVHEQLLACVGMWAVDLVHVWVLWSGAAPAWVLLLGVVAVACVNMVVCGVLDMRSRREFVRAEMQGD